MFGSFSLAGNRVVALHLATRFFWREIILNFKFTSTLWLEPQEYTETLRIFKKPLPYFHDCNFSSFQIRTINRKPRLSTVAEKNHVERFMTRRLFTKSKAHTSKLPVLRSLKEAISEGVLW